MIAIAAAVFVVALVGARAADDAPAAAQSDDLSSSHSDIDRSRIERAEPGKEWWREIVKRFPGCATLTDGCQSCVPNGDDLTCSNPGIACTRGEWHCAAEAKPEGGDKKVEPQKQDGSLPRTGGGDP